MNANANDIEAFFRIDDKRDGTVRRLGTHIPKDATEKQAHTMINGITDAFRRSLESIYDGSFPYTPAPIDEELSK